MNRRVWQSFVAAIVSLGAATSCSSAGGTTGPDSGTTVQDDTGTGKRDSSSKDGAPTGKDAAKDTGPSCGSAGPLCANGATCKADGDCKSTVCLSGTCVAESCTLSVVNGTESDVGCGGADCPACASGKKCGAASDCASKVCTAGICQAPTDTDGVPNDSETDVDCGGGLLADGTVNPASDGAPSCKVGQTCLIPSDCQQGVCATAPVLVDNLDAGSDALLPDAALLDGGSGGLRCLAPTFKDGVKNDSETDVDCGGALLADGTVNPSSDGAPTCAAMAKCALASDCQSGVCTAGICQAAIATDGVKNDSETDIDCGGALLADGTPNPASDGAPVCADTKHCIHGSDCQNLVCAPASVGTMGSADGGPVDCSSGLSCTCQPASFTDGVRNDSETDIDCGGALLVDGTTNPASDGAPVCQFQTSQNCLLGSDCNTGVCNNNAGAGGGPDNCPAMTTCACQPPWDNDGVQNGGETDVDCGGGTALGSDGAPACAPSKKCVVGTDCTSKICGTNKLCTTPTPTDGVQNGDETDVDCGGAATAGSDGAPACADSKLCGVAGDCLSAYCSTLNQRCVDGKSCVGLVAPAPIQDVSVIASATVGGADAIGIPDPNGVNQNAGIDTCGSGESTDLPSTQKHESCCKSLPVPGLAACSSTVACPVGETCSSTTTTAGTCQVRMDKYEVTTGRVRQFIESIKANDPNHAYNLQAWANAQFNANGTAATPLGTTLLTMIPTTGAANMLPLFPTGDIGVATYLSIVAQLGGTTLDEGYPSAAQGCYMGPGAYGAGTYWFDSTQLSDVVHSPPRPFTRDYYDIKPQNCTVYWIAAAFCAWDGGRLPTEAETKAVYGTGPYPWGAGSATVPPVLFSTQAEGALVTQANNAGYAITDYTVDWHNSNLGSSTGLGDFYYYPSWVSNDPPWAANVSTLFSGTDLTPYIAAPGRFTVDLTTLRSADGEGWQDYGANMMEYLETYSQTTNAGEYCDTTDPVTLTAAQVKAGATCPAGTCGRINLATGDTDCGTVRATQMPPIPWEGGSWEGHGIQLYGYNEPAHTQYGKAGFRCVRPAEP